MKNANAKANASNKNLGISSGNTNNEEKKNLAALGGDARKTDLSEFERVSQVNKKLEQLNKGVDIFDIFNSFRNIVDLSSINELKSQFNEKVIHNKLKNDNKNTNKELKTSYNCVSDVSSLYATLPKITINNNPKKQKESSEFSSSYWSPIDAKEEKKKTNKRSPSPQRLKGLNIQNRKINFSKSDSIFVTNATNEKTFMTSQALQKSGIERDDNISKKYFKDKNSSSQNNFDQSPNQSTFFPIETFI